MTGDPLANHRASATAALALGDPGAIKRLYVQLGADWLDAHQDAASLEAIPVLSAPETEPVVVRCAQHVTGALLDAGCWPKPVVSLALAASPARTVVSLDIGFGTVQVARRLAEQRGLRLIGVVGDVERLPFRDNSFNGVTCVDCVEHLPDDAAGVAELARVARPRCSVVIATPNRRNADVLRHRLHDLARGVRRPAAAYFVSTSHIREYTWIELERLVAPALALRHRAPVGWNRGWTSRLATRMLTFRPFHQVSQMLVIEAEPR